MIDKLYTNERLSALMNQLDIRNVLRIAVTKDENGYVQMYMSRKFNMADGLGALISGELLQMMSLSLALLDAWNEHLHDQYIEDDEAEATTGDEQWP